LELDRRKEKAMRARTFVIGAIVTCTVAVGAWAASTARSTPRVQPLISVSKSASGSQVVSVYYAADDAVPELQVCGDDVKIRPALPRFLSVSIRGNVHGLLVRGSSATSLEPAAWTIGSSDGLDVVIGDDGGLSFKASH
jgi:hypothetical protein